MSTANNISNPVPAVSTTTTGTDAGPKSSGSTSQPPNLPALLRRLEAATVRLEELAVRNAGGASASASASGTAKASSSHAGAGGSTSNVASASSAAGPAAGSLASGAKATPALVAYDELLATSLKTFLELSDAVGDLVAQQSKSVNQLFFAQRRIIEIAAQAKKPDLTSSDFAELIKPLQGASLAACEFRDKNRRSPLFNHLSTVSEGVPALGWVAVEPKPFPFVGEMRDAAQFYANRVIKEFKDKDRQHVDWANAYIALLTDLQNYVKAHHTTGLFWNAKGADVKSFLVASTATPAGPAAMAAAVAAGARGGAGAGAGAEAAGGDTKNALFGELNRGGDITSHLKKVDKSQMTHKNPELRAGSVVKADDKPAATAQPAFKAAAPKQPPKTALEGNKWVVENHVNGNVVLDQVELKQVVYIFNCTGSTVQIKGKVNTVSIDNCKKTGVVVDSTVAGVDLVNCKSVQVQILHYAPTVNVDKTDGCLIYMSQECVDQKLELFTAKSSEVNLSFPESAAPNSEFAEKAVAEQFKTVVVDGKLNTVPVEHKG